jgi:hypothetical protein
VADKAWKAFERRVAAFWGCLRNIGSGTLGRPDLLSASDSTHPYLFIEAKHHKRHAARTLWDKTKELAKKERKIPILALGDCGRPGWLAVIYCDDLVAVARLIVAREDALIALALQADDSLPN